MSFGCAVRYVRSVRQKKKKKEEGKKKKKKRRQACKICEAKTFEAKTDSKRMFIALYIYSVLHIFKYILRYIYIYI